jgi:hypothetical protein
LGDFPQLGVGQISGSGDFAFNDILRHGCNPDAQITSSKTMRLPWIFAPFRSR